MMRLSKIFLRVAWLPWLLLAAYASMGFSQEPSKPAAFPREKLVVLDFEVHAMGQEQSVVLAQQLAMALGKSGPWELVPRPQVEQAARARGLVVPFCPDVTCALYLGRQLGADLVLMSSARKVSEGVWQATTNLYSEETDELAGQETLTHNGDFSSLLLDGMTKLAARLAQFEQKTFSQGGPLPRAAIAPKLQDVIQQEGTTALSFSADSTLLYSAAGKRIYAWDMATRKQRGLAMGVPQGQITALAVNPRGDLLAAGTQEGQLFLFNLHQKTRSELGQARSKPYGRLVFSPRYGLLAAMGADMAPSLFQISTGSPIYDLVTQGRDVRGLLFSPEGKNLWVVSTDKPLEAFDLLSKHTKTPFTKTETQALLVTQNVSGQRLAFVLAPRGVELLVTDNQDHELADWKPHDGRITAVGFLPDARFVYTSGEDGWVRIWDAPSELILEELDAKGPVLTAQLSPNGKWLAAVTRQGVITLWEILR